MKIIFLAPYPYDRAASQRFRFEQYFKVLREKEISYSFYSFYTSWAFNALYSPKKILILMIGILCGFLLRIYHISRCIRYDYVFIHRELTPIGPPLFEWVVTTLLKKKVIYDFDDAIWLTDEPQKNKILLWFKYSFKVKYICEKSYRISTGNDFLGNFAALVNKDIVVNPTTIDTSQTRFIQVNHLQFPVTIGWTGSHTTLKYLNLILDPLQKILYDMNQVNFLVICNRKPHWLGEGMEFVYWSKKTEWKDLSRIQIGLMPLSNDEWAKGKCGFKLLQYFSIGIPALASPVGVNNRIIIHQKNGFLCNTHEDWLNYLSILIKDVKLRENMGISGKQMVEDQFSLNANRENFLGLFE